MELPARMPVTAPLPDAIKKALSIAPQAVYKARDYVLVYRNEQEILDLQINRAQLDQINLDPGGVVVTAIGRSVRFCIAIFYPTSHYFRRSCYRIGPLLLGAFLGRTTSKKRVGCTATLATRRSFKMPSCRRQGVVGRPGPNLCGGLFMDGVKPNFSKIKHLYYKLGTVLVSVGT